MNYFTLLSILILSFAALNSLVFMIKPHQTRCDLKMLGITLLFYNIFLLTYFLWFDAGYLLDYPHLLRTVSPLMYLTGPFIYFYVRNTLEGTKGLRSWDWLHFLPALFHFVELVPFYTLPLEVKQQLVKEILEDIPSFHWKASGIIPIAYHYVFRLLLLLGYYLYSFSLINKLVDLNLHYSRITEKKSWFLLSFYLTGALIIGHAGYEFFSYLIWKNWMPFSFLPDLFAYVTIFGLLYMNVYINFNPEHIYDYKTQIKFSDSSESYT